MGRELPRREMLHRVKKGKGKKGDREKYGGHTQSAKRRIAFTSVRINEKSCLCEIGGEYQFTPPSPLIQSVHHELASVTRERMKRRRAKLVADEGVSKRKKRRGHDDELL